MTKILLVRRETIGGKRHPMILWYLYDLLLPFFSLTINFIYSQCVLRNDERIEFLRKHCEIRTYDISLLN